MFFRKLLQTTSRQLLLPSQHKVTCLALAHTIKVKRHHEIEVDSKGQPIENWKNYIYTVDYIEKGPKNLKVILNEDMLDVGVKGEIVDLPKSVSRYLLRNNLAMYASPENIKEHVVKYETKQTQTMTGRKTAMWLQHQDVFNIQLRTDVEWKLTPEVLSRCLLKSNKLNAPPETITMPDYDITNLDVGKDVEHEIKLSINQAEPVTIKIKITEAKMEQQ
uniref:Large ribosomal subunit protein bL9m n=1 Tax=Phallusia mammillata TaxID=59560 RepID=A0A6F9DID2_9ASCI|nr:uncharacterized protein LOC100185851 [Phallusia mammillata]